MVTLLMLLGISYLGLSALSSLFISRFLSVARGYRQELQPPQPISGEVRRPAVAKASMIRAN